LNCELKPSDIFVPSRSAAFRRIGDEVIIVDTLAGRMMSLNETGSAIWELLGVRSLDEICHELTNRYEVDSEQALREVIVFLEVMLSRGLIETARTASADPGP